MEETKTQKDISLEELVFEDSSSELDKDNNSIQQIPPDAL